MNSGDLFRPESVDFQRKRLYGAVSVSTPPSTWFVTALVSMIVAAAAVILTFGTYSRKETVYGWVTPDVGLARVNANANAVVEKVHVREGDIVQKGEGLITLSQETGLNSGRALIESLLAEVEQEERALQTRIRSIRDRSKLTQQELNLRRDNIVTRLTEMHSRIALQDERVKLAQDMLGRLTSLAVDGASSEIEVVTQRQLYLAEEQTRKALSEELLSMDQERQQIEASILTLLLDEEDSIAEIDGALAVLAGRRATLVRQGAEVIRAPVAGRVLALPAHPGQSVTPNSFLAAIIPEGGILEAQLFVPTRAIGFIREGQATRLQYDAFPYQKFGWGNGRVVSISKTVYLPEDIPAKLIVGEPAYRVSVAISDPFVEAFGDRYFVQSGMTLRAVIVQEETNLWLVLFGSVFG